MKLATGQKFKDLNKIFGYKSSINFKNCQELVEHACILVAQW